MQKRRKRLNYLRLSLTQPLIVIIAVIPFTIKINTYLFILLFCLFFIFNLILDFTSIHHQHDSVILYWYSKAYTIALGPCCGTALCSSQKTIASAVVKVNSFLNGSSINRMLNNRIMHINKAGGSLPIYLI